MTDRDATREHREESDQSDQPVDMQASVSKPVTSVGEDRSVMQHETDDGFWVRGRCPDCGQPLFMCRC